MIVEVTFAVEVEDPEELFSAFAERYAEENGDDSVQDVRDEWSDEAGNLDVPGMVAWLLDTGSPPGCCIDAHEARIVAKDWDEYRAAQCDECGARIPPHESEMVNAYHRESCSLHPSAVAANVVQIQNEQRAFDKRHNPD